jgi:hypothetical protein
MRPRQRRSRTRAPLVGPRALRARRGGRVVLRLPVPEEIVHLVGFAAEHPGSVRSRYWTLVREKMEAFVMANVPEGAVCVRTVLDEARTEVVLTYRREGDADAVR